MLLVSRGLPGSPDCPLVFGCVLSFLKSTSPRAVSLPERRRGKESALRPLDTMDGRTSHSSCRDIVELTDIVQRAHTHTKVARRGEGARILFLWQFVTNELSRVNSLAEFVLRATSPTVPLRPPGGHAGGRSDRRRATQVDAQTASRSNSSFG